MPEGREAGLSQQTFDVLNELELGLGLLLGGTGFLLLERRAEEG